MIDETVLRWSATVLSALAALLLTRAALTGLSTLWTTASRRLRLSPLHARLNAIRPSSTLPTSTPHFNWPLLQLAGGLAGLALGSACLSPPFSAIGALIGYGLPRFIRHYLQRRARTRTQLLVRAFVDELGLLPLDLGLAPALSLIADRQAHGLLSDRLNLHLKTMRLGGDPLDVLRSLAADLRSDALADLARRVDAARQGGDSIEVALYEQATDLAASLLADARIAAESLPNRLMFPVLVTLFPPILILALYPVAMYLIDTLTSVGAGQPLF